jgi:hypothetical protein
MPLPTYRPGLRWPGRLILLLAHHGLTYAEAAAKVRMSRDTLRRWISGESWPSRPLWIRFARAFSLDPMPFLRRPGEPLAWETPEERAVAVLIRQLEAMDDFLPDLTDEELDELDARLRATRRHLRSARRDRAP